MFGATLSLTCSHRLRDLLLRGESLIISDFYPYWQIHNETVGAINWPMTTVKSVTVLPRIRNNVSKKKGTGEHRDRWVLLLAERILQATSAQRRSGIQTLRCTEIFTPVPIANHYLESTTPISSFYQASR